MHRTWKAVTDKDASVSIEAKQQKPFILENELHIAPSNEASSRVCAEQAKIIVVAMHALGRSLDSELHLTPYNGDIAGNN